VLSSWLELEDCSSLLEEECSWLLDEECSSLLEEECSWLLEDGRAMELNPAALV
jgi:hypothetical protein